MKVLSNQQGISFGAVPLAQWRCKTLNNKIKNVTIASFEPKDINFVQKFIEKINSICKNDVFKKEMVDITIRTIRDILYNFKDKRFEKTKAYIAIQDGTPCGLLIGNIPKQILGSDTIRYSARHNCAKNETELDWLVTWQPKGKSKIKGIGKALVCEYFRTIKKDKFRDVFVRAEIPENSYATDFYESLGFEEINKKRFKFLTKNSAQYVISNYGEASDDIIPMLITRKTLQDMTEFLSKEMARQEFKRKSMNIEEIAKI